MPTPSDDEMWRQIEGLIGQIATLSASLNRYGVTLPWNVPRGLMGSAQKTSNQTGISTTADITSLSVTFTAVSTRLYKTTLYLPVLSQNTLDSFVTATIADNGGTAVQQGQQVIKASQSGHMMLVLIETGLSGSTVRKGRVGSASGTVDVTCSSTIVASLFVEDIGPFGNPA